MSDPVDMSTSEYAQSFGTEAARYDRYRPGYPSDAIEFVLAGRAVSHILDLGAGTGKLTRSLVGRAEQVTAIEPDADMLAVLSASLPSVQALPGGAGEIPLPDSSVDAVLVGQAFHWFPRPEADREIARVLRPGGVVGLIWNFPDREVEWIPKIYEATREPQMPWSYRADDLDPSLFTPPEKDETSWVYKIDGDDALIELARTWSWVIAQAPAEQAAVEQRLRILRTQYADMQGPVFRLPQRTRVVRQYLR